MMTKTVLLAALLSTPGATFAASLTELAPTYSQNFNGLSDGPAFKTWTDDVTIPGWYASRANYYAWDGSLNLGDLYGYGANGSSDRALGSATDGGTGPIAWGVLLTNGGTGVIESLQVDYVGEQWRNGSGSSTAQTITFSYGTTATDVQTAADLAGTVASLNFTSPVHDGVSLALDGNAAANRSSRGGSITGLNLLPGQSIFLQWRDVNDPGTEHGLAVDDLSVTARFAAAPVPLPGAAAAGFVLVGGLLARRRGGSGPC
jgi:hypothetical protein